MSEIQNTPSNTAKTTSTGFRVLPNLSADQAMLTAENLRSQASKYNDQYVVMGRKALLALMVDIYKLYHDARESSDNGIKFMEKVKEKLKQQNFAVRKSSPESSQLIRYICKDFDDKQVSIYGGSLAVAFSRKIDPANFAEFIEGSQGGFSGIRSTDTPTKTDNAGSHRSDIALAGVRTEKTIETIEVNDWGTDEDYRVLIAIRNDDDTAAVKDAKLSLKSLQAVILRYEADKRARLKSSKNQQQCEIDKATLKELVAEAANAETTRGNIEAELNAAIASGDTETCKALRPRLQTATLLAKSAQDTRKHFAATLKEAVAA